DLRADELGGDDELRIVGDVADVLQLAGPRRPRDHALVEGEAVANAVVSLLRDEPEPTVLDDVHGRKQVGAARVDERLERRGDRGVARTARPESVLGALHGGG